MRERDGKGGRVSVMLSPFVCCCETQRVRFLETSEGDIAHFLLYILQYVNALCSVLDVCNKKKTSRASHAVGNELLVAFFRISANKLRSRDATQLEMEARKREVGDWLKMLLKHLPTSLQPL